MEGMRAGIFFWYLLSSFFFLAVIVLVRRRGREGGQDLRQSIWEFRGRGRFRFIFFRIKWISGISFLRRRRQRKVKFTWFCVLRVKIFSFFIKLCRIFGCFFIFRLGDIRGFVRRQRFLLGLLFFERGCRVKQNICFVGRGSKEFGDGGIFRR